MTNRPRVHSNRHRQRHCCVGDGLRFLWGGVLAVSWSVHRHAMNALQNRAPLIIVSPGVDNAW